MMIRKYFLGAALVFFIFSAGRSYAAQDAMPLSLKQCIDLALQNNIEVLVARARQQQAQGQEAVWTADLLPQIDAVASQQRTWWENIGALGFSGFTGVIGPFNTFDAKIMVSQRILDFSALAHAQAGKFKTESSQLGMELASQQVIMATGLAYIQALGYAQELTSSYEDVRLADHFLSLSLHQLDAGLASSVDVARDRTQLAQQKARQEELRLNVIKSQLELKQLIRVPLSQPIELTDVLENENYNYLKVDEAIARAQEDRIEMQVARADSGYSLSELKASKREVLPKINVTGEWGETGLTPDKEVTHAADAMVSVSLPIWEGGRIAGDIKEKAGLNEEQKIKSDDLNWKIEEDVRVSLETLVSTRAQVDAVRKVEDFAQKELNLAQDRFTAGLGDNTQVIDAQVALTDAKDKYVQTLAQYDQAQLNYFAALGDPKQFDLSVDDAHRLSS
jgi:outer membrane protein